MSINSLVKEYGILFPKLIPYIKSLKIYPEKKVLSKNEIQNLIFNYLKNDESWDKAGHKTSFNQIQKLRFNNIVNDVSRNISSNKSYLELKNDTKFYIRKQDEFHYILICSVFDYLRKNKHIELLNEFFVESDDDLFVNERLVQIESSEKTKDGNHYRTDMSFIINSKKIVVEYLEKQHERDKDLDYPFEKTRALNLMFNNKSVNNEIVHISYFWDCQYGDKKYYKNFVTKLCKLIVDYWDISDKDKYTIRKLTEIVKSRELAEQIYLAHTNRNKPEVKVGVIDKMIKWNKSSSNELWYSEFKNKVKNYVDENNQSCAFDDSEDEETDEEVNIKLTKEITSDKYYQVIDNQVYLTQSGLHLYISVEKDYLNDYTEYFRLRKFYEDITQGLVDILSDYRMKELELKQQFISGLE
jgi:hypothetical protein